MCIRKRTTAIIIKIYRTPCGNICYIYRIKPCATNKCSISYSRHSAADSDARKSSATGKCRAAYVLDAIRNSDARKSGTIIECITCYSKRSFFYGISSRQRCFCCYQVVANIKHLILPICSIIIICRIVECLSPYVCYTVRNNDARKSDTTRKCIIAYACHAIRNSYTRKSGAITERITAYACYATVRWYHT